MVQARKDLYLEIQTCLGVCTLIIILIPCKRPWIFRCY